MLRSLILGFALLAPGALAAQERARPLAPKLPFGPGELLEYRVHVSIAGNVGNAVMRVDGPVSPDSALIWVLHFDMDARRGLIRATDRTTSWLDPVRFAVSRFEKTERHPLSWSSEKVRIDLALGTFTDADSPPAPLGSYLPLDELSFLFFLRTLPIDRDSTFRFDRHFDPARNPTFVRVMGEEIVTTPAGIFRTRIVEMDVRDPKRFRGTGTVRMYIDIGACRVPVRIESRMPVLGTTTLILTGWAHPPRYPGAFHCDG